MFTPQVLKIDFDLPANTGNLKTIELNLVEIKKELFWIKKTKKFEGNKHTEIYEDVILNLDWLGRMSTPIFDLRDELEAQYEKIYCKQPKLAYQLFSEHYSRLHHPYSLLKNRCFNLLEDIDALYIEMNNTNPPNYKL